MGGRAGGRRSAPGGDVRAVLRPVEGDLADPRVRRGPRRGHVGAGADHRQHPAPGGDQVVAVVDGTVVNSLIEADPDPRAAAGAALLAELDT